MAAAAARLRSDRRTAMLSVGRCDRSPDGLSTKPPPYDTTNAPCSHRRCSDPAVPRAYVLPKGRAGRTRERPSGVVRDRAPPFPGSELPKCKGAPPVRGRRALQNLGVRWPRLLGGAPDGYKHCVPRTPAAWQRKKRVALQRLREGILDDDGDSEGPACAR